MKEEQRADTERLRSELAANRAAADEASRSRIKDFLDERKNSITVP
jgi:hypothetical protein